MTIQSRALRAKEDTVVVTQVNKFKQHCLANLDIEILALRLTGARTQQRGEQEKGLRH